MGVEQSVGQEHGGRLCGPCGKEGTVNAPRLGSGSGVGGGGEIRSQSKAQTGLGLRGRWGRRSRGLRRGGLLQWHLLGKIASETGWLVLFRGGHGLGVF